MAVLHVQDINKIKDLLANFAVLHVQDTQKSTTSLLIWRFHIPKFGDRVLLDRDNEVQSYSTTLGDFSITDGSTLDVVLIKPPATCDDCDASANGVGAFSSISSRLAGKFYLRCCGQRLCQDCLIYHNGHPCPFCKRPQLNADQTEASRKHWGGI